MDLACGGYPGVPQAKPKFGADWRTAKFCRPASASPAPRRALRRDRFSEAEHLVLVSTILSRESIIPGKDRWWSSKGEGDIYIYIYICLYTGLWPSVLLPEAKHRSGVFSSSFFYILLPQFVSLLLKKS
jgi:hypothetical protein